ncbi:hypothetical protein [Bradyrhizobium brasilense]|uniref:hypothetical protein n=1 Tax=Bradyrhizobium brasilense TaxID=1419277 RepID=UPI001F24BB94|nr:hypothetical protein [Bradyrhizobium brasilense]
MTSVKGQLLVMLETVAKALGDDLRGRLVFVGGCTTALFITDEITLEGVRATDDVDLIVDLVGHAQWAQLQEQLRQKGFAESPEDDVICRMRLGNLKVDFMPDDESILGFSNRWYGKGIETAASHPLTDTSHSIALGRGCFVAKLDHIARLQECAVAHVLVLGLRQRLLSAKSLTCLRIRQHRQPHATFVRHQSGFPG